MSFGQIARVFTALWFLSLASVTAADELLPEQILIQNVHVISMVQPGIHRNRDVLISDGLIAAISDERMEADSAIILDGTGRYLMPGLHDLHTHLSFLVDRNEPISEHELQSFLTFGVTTIFNQGEFAVPLGDGIEGLKKMLAAGTLAGPHLYTASYVRSPGMGTDIQTVTDYESAAALVRASKAAGYEAMKVYHGISEEAYQGVLDTAAKLGMPVIGHPPLVLPLEKTLAMGLDVIAHAESFTYSYFNNETRYDDIPAMVSMYRKYRPFILTTSHLEVKVSRLWGGDEAVFNAFTNERHKDLVHPLVISEWKRDVLDRWVGGDPEKLAQINPFIQAYVKELRKAGARFVMGTDGPLVIGVPGYGVHEELQYLVSLGFSTSEALATATRTAGEFLQAHALTSAPVGTIQQGHQADLILLGGNPLDDLGYLEDIAAVINDGKLYRAEDLAAMRTRIIDYNKSFAAALASGDVDK